MASLGEYLRQARERRGVTLEDVARVTRIRRQHLEALEADRLEDLPAPPFVRGFLSAYAKQIGLAPDDVLARFEAAKASSAEAGATSTPPARRGESTALPAASAPSPARPSQDAPHSSSHGSRSVLVLVALVGVGALAVVGSMLARPSAPPVRPIAAPVPVPTPAAAPSILPSPAIESSIAPQSSPAQAVVTSSDQVGDTSPLPGRVEAVSARPAAPSPSPARALPGAPPGSPAVATVAARRSTLSVSATEETWVQVIIDGGAPVEASLRPGDRVSWQGAGFEIVVGNAGGVTLELDGVRQPPLGESGRRVTLRLPRPPAQ